MAFLGQSLLSGAALAEQPSHRIEATDLYDLSRSQVVILGEIHDNPIHHAHQAIAVEALGARALVFEMLTDAQARRITPGLDRSEPTLRAALQWDESGWPDFAMYYPIFAASGEAIVFGGALPRAAVRRSVTVGAAEVFGESAGLFGLTDGLDDHEQAIREKTQMDAHCGALPVSMLSGMVQAQRLRDAAMARAVVAALAETGGPVAVITGNGHARRDWGIARTLALVAPEVSVTSLGQFEDVPTGPVPFDFWLVTDPQDRPDPCRVFDPQDDDSSTRTP